MGRYFDENYRQLKDKLLHMSSLVQDVIGRTFESLADENEELARELIATDGEIDALENEVDELVLKLLALQQPMAVDLRFLVAVLKINNDLERMGDQAVNIAHGTILLHEHGHHATLIDFAPMERIVKSMVHDCMKAFVDGDAELARRVRARDDAVDTMNFDIIRALISHIEKNPADADMGVTMLLISRNLERIADLATNIAEDVVYQIEGRIIRHVREDRPEQPQ